MTNEQIETARVTQRGEKKADILAMRATTDLNGLLSAPISSPIVVITLGLCGTAIFIAAIAVGLRFF